MSDCKERKKKIKLQFILVNVVTNAKGAEWSNFGILASQLQILKSSSSKPEPSHLNRACRQALIGPAELSDGGPSWGRGIHPRSLTGRRWRAGDAD